jgi:hypothetical protein
MKKNLKMLSAATLCCLLANFANADLLGVNPGYPLISYVDTTDPTALSYDPVSQIFSVDALPYSIYFSDIDSAEIAVSNRSFQITLDTDGNLISGANGFSVTGQFTHVVNGVTNNYSGLLLQGDVTAFGYLNSGGPVSQFDFRIQVTGGELQPLFDCANDVAVTITSEDSSFTGTFTTAFDGTVKGSCGPEDITPPIVTCPPLSQVVTTPTIDPNTGNPAFLITYPDPIVTDNCDPDPTIYCDTPSGSIVDLNPGDQLTVTCYGIDDAGNYSDCSFTVTMGVNNAPPPCTLAFEGSGCGPVTLPTDVGQCSATYSFSPPIATNCTSQFTATATALNEAGTVITLTTLANGELQGVFPRTLTQNGDIITFTASDGQGNSVVQQCQVFVKDTQPPTITCVDQSATFKPILTNALSCISANFNNPCIASNNYLWFSSVIQASSCQNRGGVFTVHITDQTIQLAVDNTNITLSVPDAYVYFSNGVATATTIFTNNEWVTYSSLNFGGNTFASGLSWQVPFNINNLMGGCWGRDGGEPFRRHVNTATWCARFAINTNGVALQWQWGAVVETKASPDFNALRVKPIDSNRGSCWNNSDPAGACESYKPYLIPGACGSGISQQGRNQVFDCTGALSQKEPCNLGKGIICEGAVYFTTPVASDNCGNAVQVTCNPPSGTVFGPGDQVINCTAVDSSGNSNECSFTLTVLAPVQVVFDSPACDNLADNTSEPDAGYTDFNCPDDPSTPEQVTCFHVGQCVFHQVRLLDCNGNDVTASLASCVTVHIDVTEREGSYANSCLVNDVAQNYSGVGCPGSIMVPCNGTFQYNLNTTGYPAKTVNTSTFFRSCVWVDYNSSPGVPVGMEDVLLQSQ